jgi:hypothetical protein
MTQWIENPTGGRDRGPIAMLRAWYEVVVHPFRFFDSGVAPGDQAPGLTFAMTVVFFEELTRIVLVPNTYPGLTGDTYAFLQSRPLFAVLWLGVAVLLITPAVLHLVGAVATVVLMPLVSDRGGVSETVQVIAYATAPCVFAGVPVLELQALSVTYGAVLLVIGLGVVHGTTLYRALLAGAVPILVGFVYGFRGVEAVGTLLRQWFII